MATQRYTASLSQSQGRSGYSIIFRHPVRRDETGKPGIRVRRGLGTRDKAEAERLRDELNRLLADPKYHDPAARAEAERRFDLWVVDIFFDKMVPERVNYSDLREKAIHLPPSGEPDGYRHVLFLGTTGAGKTTLVRQLIGTDPKTERFPATSTSRTTIHDTEIIMDDGPWRAVVTFVSSDETREYLKECISSAILEAYRDRDADDTSVLRRLLNHVDQRFRFNYVLGNGPKTEPDISDFDEESESEDDVESFLNDEPEAIDLAATNELLAHTVEQLRELATRYGDRLREELDAESQDDERTINELFEEELDNLLREDEDFHRITDNLMDEIEKRFELLSTENVNRNQQDWPQTWTREWPAEQRAECLKEIGRFSSNHASRYGYLLTPLVTGVRVAGPFSPKWTDGQAKLVLLDGEGLGHTPKSSSSVSTAVSRGIKAADAVVLVDNATQPMQAAPMAAMREVVATGNGSKLILAFTHFDEVTGDNLPGVRDKEQHVLDSAKSVLAAFGKDLGPSAERVLRKRIEGARFFLANIHEPLSDNTKAGRRTMDQLRRLLGVIDQVIERPQPVEGRPVYDRTRLVLAVHAAAKAFQEEWRTRLGLEYTPGFEKEHWARIKALSRRMATMGEDEYRWLRPVADLRRELTNRLYPFIQNPLRWHGPDPSEEEKQNKYDDLANNLSERLLDLATRRVWKMRVNEWQDAYDQSGRGSTFDRARIIDSDIYEPASLIPDPDVTPSPDRNEFMREVVAEVEAATREIGAELR